MKFILSTLVILSFVSYTLSNDDIDWHSGNHAEADHLGDPLTTAESRIDLTAFSDDEQYFNSRGSRQIAWGSRSIDMSRFSTPQDPNNPNRWVAYFHEETIVPVLQTPDRYMVDCTVIEVKRDQEQREAMEDLGTIMELSVINLDDMITLIKLCGSLHPPQTSFSRSINTETSGELPKLTPGSMVLPGTLWCGMRDIARNYEDIGDKVELDKCCRDHDHCPIKLGTFETRYGASNFGLATRSHCACDQEFYQCLKATQDKTATVVGDFYFNLLQLRCIDEKRSRSRDGENSKMPLYKCIRRDQEGRCRMWQKNLDFSLSLETKRPIQRF